MRLASSIVLALGVSLAAPHVARADAPVAFVIPPLEVEWGRAANTSSHGAFTESQITVALSWAAIYPESTPVDLSVGLIILGSSAEDDAAPAAKSRTVEADPSTLRAGVFVAADVRIVEGDHWRTWIGGRGEKFHFDDGPGYGGVVRASAELWTPAVGSDDAGFMFGTAALSLWAEAGVRDRPDGERGAVVAAGFGLRCPFLLLHN